MKTCVGTLALLGAVLLGGSALAQTPPKPGASSTVPAARSVSGGSSGASADEGQARGTNLPQTPVNGIGGFGGGRLLSTPPTHDPDDNVAAQSVAPATGTVPAGQGQGQPLVTDKVSNSLPRGKRMHKPF